MNSIKKFVTVGAVSLCLLSAQSCYEKEDGLLIFAASSLRDALDPLGQEYEALHNTKVRFSFGGSVTLAHQLSRNAPGDVFISAGRGPMDVLKVNNVLAEGTESPLLSNRMVVVIPEDMENKSHDIMETLKKSNRIALADPKLAPAGSYAREAIQHLGVWEQIAPKVVFGGDVRSVLAYVESGAVDVGIVYYTDALTSSGVNISHEVPDALHSPIIYPVAVLRHSNNKKSGQNFIAFLKGRHGQAAFEGFGFGVTISQ